MVPNKMGQTAFFVGRDDHIGGVQDFGMGVGDRGSQTDRLKHGQIIQMITDGSSLFCGEIELLGNDLDSRTLGNPWRENLKVRVRGLDEGQGLFCFF